MCIKILGYVTIIVEDVNDNHPKFRKPFYKFFVTENSKNGIVVGNVVADDADKNRTINYFIETSNDIKELIQITKHSGDIVVSDKIDHEKYEWINLTVS